MSLDGMKTRKIPNKKNKVYTLTGVAVSTDYDILTDMEVAANTVTLVFNQNASVYTYNGSAWSDAHTHTAGIETIFKDEYIEQVRVVPAVAGSGTLECSGW